MLSFLNRYLPVLIAISVLLMAIQLLRQVWPSASALSTTQQSVTGFLHAWGWYFVSAGTVLALLALAGWAHWRGSAPLWLYRVISMDILDRLTNKQQVEDAARSGQMEQAAQLFQSLRADLNSVCGELAAFLEAPTPNGP